MVLTNLAQHLTLDWYREAFRRTKKRSAPGIDRRTATQYAERLEDNLTALRDRVKAGRYFAPPVRRVHIPKGNGETRPIGIPTIEDKILQRAVAMILEEVYEPEFLPCSYGFRRGRSAHQALEDLWRIVMDVRGGWVLEVDIRKFFDNLGHRHLREILDLRIRDKAIVRLIGKWLNAGVVDGESLTHPEAGTPQGGVISPLLANVYLHEVLDTWFYRDVLPRLRGKARLVRYADDFVMVFAHEVDARRVMEVLPKRFARFGLEAHPGKTRLVDFRHPAQKRQDPPPPDDRRRPPGSFTLLGFTHHWARSRRGRMYVKRKTSKKSFAKALASISAWCKRWLHSPLPEQHRKLAQKLRGHCAYFGITGNSEALSRFRSRLIKVWRRWRKRTSQRGGRAARRLDSFLQAHPLPEALAVHSTLRAARR